MSENKLSMSEKFAEIDPENKDFHLKQDAVKKHRIERQYSDMVERQRQAEKAKKINVTHIDPKRIESIVKKNKEYMLQARQSKVFLTEDFQGKVPYFPRNIILAAARTGEGKSTTCANISFHAITQGQRILVITNEENVGDVYNRVTCLLKKISYNDHTQFSDEQIDMFGDMMRKLSSRMTVIDDTFNGEMNQTTSIEGIESILKSLLNNPIKYDAIILDYYQNIDKSIEDPSMTSWQAQEKFCKFIDSFKNIYDAPIILLAQKNQHSEGKSFKESIEGRKVVLNVATCALEIEANRELLCTEWTIRKSRFAGAVGETIRTGYKRGKYVPYDAAFKVEVQHQNERKKMEEQRKRVSSKISELTGKKDK